MFAPSASPSVVTPPVFNLSAATSSTASSSVRAPFWVLVRVSTFKPCTVLLTRIVPVPTPFAVNVRERGVASLTMLRVLVPTRRSKNSILFALIDRSPPVTTNLKCWYRSP
jgi:hypothetical protein